jgi:hypothetical protein
MRSPGPSSSGTSSSARTSIAGGPAPRASANATFASSSPASSCTIGVRRSASAPDVRILCPPCCGWRRCARVPTPCNCTFLAPVHPCGLQEAQYLDLADIDHQRNRRVSAGARAPRTASCRCRPGPWGSGPAPGDSPPSAAGGDDALAALHPVRCPRQRRLGSTRSPPTAPRGKGSGKGQIPFCSFCLHLDNFALAGAL